MAAVWYPDGRRMRLAPERYENKTMSLDAARSVRDRRDANTGGNWDGTACTATATVCHSRSAAEGPRPADEASRDAQSERGHSAKDHAARGGSCVATRDRRGLQERL